MGGANSGRTTDKRLAEECLSLDLAKLMRAGDVAKGKTIAGKVSWPQDCTPITSVKFQLDLRSARLSLIFHSPLADGQSREISQAIALTSTAQNFGGRRWWLRCPVTGSRARKLYLSPESDRFASRQAWSLGYRVERLSHFDRPFEKMFRAQRNLGGEQGLGASGYRLTVESDWGFPVDSGRANQRGCAVV
jgi:hypothetical protein